MGQWDAALSSVGWMDEQIMLSADLKVTLSLAIFWYISVYPSENSARFGRFIKEIAAIFPCDNFSC